MHSLRLNLQHRILSTTLMMVLACFMGNVQKLHAETSAWSGSTIRYSQGSGTWDDPYLISSAEEFAYLMQNYDNSLGIYARRYFKLTTDLDMKGVRWNFSNAFTNQRTFRSHFDGDGHKISNLEVEVFVTDEATQIGVFPQLGGDDDFESVIENLEIDGITFSREDALGREQSRFNVRIGGLVGQQYSNSVIQNCIVHGVRFVNNGVDRTLNDANEAFVLAPLVADVRARFGTLEPDGGSAQIVNSFGVADVNCNIKGRQVTLVGQQGEMPTGFATERDGYTWYNQGNGHFSFTPLDVDIKEVGPASPDQFEAVFIKQPGHTYTYQWSINGVRIPDNTPEVTVLPTDRQQTLEVTILDNGKEAGNDARFIEFDTYQLKVAKVVPMGNTFNIRTELQNSRGERVNSMDFLYTWIDVDAEDAFQEVGTSSTLTGALPNHTYILKARHRRYSNIVVSMMHTFHTPVYVNYSGISADNAAHYTTDKKTYPQGNDSNDGRTPETAVRTLKRAYELLVPANLGGTAASNVIIIMGDYPQNDFSEYLDFHKNVHNPTYFVKDKPAIISGCMGNIRNGRLAFCGETIILGADTRFDQLVMHGLADRYASNSVAKVFASHHNVTFGYGLSMANYRQLDLTRSLFEGFTAPHFSVFGGALNSEDTKNTYEENTLCFYSGFYGRIVAGGSFNKVAKKIGNVYGSPSNPTRTRLIVDIANTTDPQKNTYDVAMLVGGQVDGSCYAVNRLYVRGASRVGRVIGGNNGFGREAYFEDNRGNRFPSADDSFFGQCVINVVGGTVGEIYGTGLGRFVYHPEGPNDEGQRLDTCATYFYGKTIINLRGGVVTNNIYGAGAASVSGLGKGRLHSFDPNVPYLNGKTLTYGPYERALGHMPSVQITPDSTIDLNHTDIEINISGKIRMQGTIHGGGRVYNSQVTTREALCQSGALFGDVHINMSGGVVNGYIFGGGKGDLSYFDNIDNTSKKDDLARHEYFKRSALLVGNSYIDISGGHVKGMVFGGGEGCYFRPVSEEKPNKNAASEIAELVGSTHIHISGSAVLDDYVFGAGNYANIRTGFNNEILDAGSTYINIEGGKFGNSIFGAGHGHTDKINPDQSVIAMVDGSTNITVTGGTFDYVSSGTRYWSERYYGIYGSGMSHSTVKGDTWLNLYCSLFTNNFLHDSGFNAWSNDKGWDHRFCYCGGGFGEKADVIGNTHVMINVKDAPSVLGSSFNEATDEDHLSMAQGILFMDIYGGGFAGDVYGSTLVDIKGNIIARNVYGGGMLGNVGVSDEVLNGDMYTPDNSVRKYKTSSTINIRSGYYERIFGGAQMGNVGGEAFVNIGTIENPELNTQIVIDQLYGGNDLSGTLAGSNNDNYGTHINIYGGRLNNVYGAGNGKSRYYDQPDPEHDDSRNMLVGKPRPHLACTYINVQGIDSKNRANIDQALFGGGDNATVGCFKLSKFDRPELHMLREELIPNTGQIHINIGSHVSIANLVMGSNGRRLMSYVPSWTADGKEWYRGFQNTEDFELFCRHVDVGCVPQLTFNNDGRFHNNHIIDDRMNRMTHFNTPNEMNSTDVVLNSFIGGAYAGSMTCDSLYQYTLPPGVIINDKIVGGCTSAQFKYSEREGPQAGKKRRFVGGMRPYRKLDEARNEQRIQLNIFCQFIGMVPKIDQIGRRSHKGAKIYGGCLDKGAVVGVAVVNLHSNMLGKYRLDEGETLQSVAREWNSNVGQIFGGGKGRETEVVGNTYVNLKGGMFNGKKCMPNAIHAFGGGAEGNVIGRTNVYCDFQCPEATPADALVNNVWGNVYGGGLSGSVVRKSKLFPDLDAPREDGSHVRVWSGQIGSVYGGSRNGNIEGCAYVDIEDRGENHYHTIINSVYGGNDLTGTIGTGSIRRLSNNDEVITTNTYVRIHERAKEDGSYTGFPLIAEVFGGGNGEYGESSEGTTYVSGSVDVLNGKTLKLAGMDRPNVDSTYIEITGGTVWYLYGGARNAHVTTTSTIDVNYTPECRQAMACFNGHKSKECFERGKFMTEFLKADGGYEIADNQVKAQYNIMSVFGGSKVSTMTIQPNWRLISGHINNVYGGTNLGNAHLAQKNMHPGSKGLTLNFFSDDILVDNVFAGCRLGNVQGEGEYGAVVQIEGGRFGRVFGGNDISGTIQNGTLMQLSGGIINEVYGSGNGEYVYQYSSEVDKVTAIYDAKMGSYICKVPCDSKFGGIEANIFQKFQAINAVRPNVSRTHINVGGTPNRKVYISGALYGGGNCATVVGPTGRQGDLMVNLNDYAIINKVYLGSNGQRHVDLKYLENTLRRNGILNPDLRDTKGRTVLDYHMDAVKMYGLPRDFKFQPNYECLYIGSFYLGSARGSTALHGTYNITFPESLNIFDKIVAGSDRSRIAYEYNNTLCTHEGGNLFDGEGSHPVLNLKLLCKFITRQMDVNPQYAKDDYLKRIPNSTDGIPAIYGGNFQSGVEDWEPHLLFE